MLYIFVNFRLFTRIESYFSAMSNTNTKAPCLRRISILSFNSLPSIKHFKSESIQDPYLNSNVFYFLPCVHPLLPLHYDPQSIVWLNTHGTHTQMSQQYERILDDMELFADILPQEIIEEMYSDIEFQNFLQNWCQDNQIDI